MKGKKELGAVRIGVGKKEDTLVLCSLCLQSQDHVFTVDFAACAAGDFGTAGTVESLYYEE